MQSNQLLSPSLDRCIHTIECDILTSVSTVQNNLAARLKKPNLNNAEFAALESVLSLDVGYTSNKADKNYAPTVYSKELAREQCYLHLETKGLRRKENIAGS